jgi:hypothetical protein
VNSPGTRYVKLTGSDGKPVWINAADPPTRIMQPANLPGSALSFGLTGSTALIWSGGDIQCVIETVEQVFQALGAAVVRS